MTNGWIDIKNTDMMLIMGGNPAENHPCGFKWAIEAKRTRNAKMIVVDPRFTRTAATSDLFCQIRAGADIAFLGGMIRYAIENNRIAKEYLVNYTNAAFIVKEGFKLPEDGLYSGFDAGSQTYDRSSWTYEYGNDAGGVTAAPPAAPAPHAAAAAAPAGPPPVGSAKPLPGLPPKVAYDLTLQHPRCVFQLLKQQYSRYTPEMVERITGIPKDQFLKAADTVHFRPQRWRHEESRDHPVRGGMDAAQLRHADHPHRGHAAVAAGQRGARRRRRQRSARPLQHSGRDRHGRSVRHLPGYLKVPNPTDTDLAAWLKRITPTASKPAPWDSFNYYSNTPKFAVSYLKALYGDAATKENDFAFNYMPKVDRNYSWTQIWDNMYRGAVKGMLAFGMNGVAIGPDSQKNIDALKKADFLVVGEIYPDETSEFWKSPGITPEEMKTINTTVYRLACAGFAEKDGSMTNSARWLQWKNVAVPPPGECRLDQDIVAQIFLKVRELYQTEGGKFPDPILNLTWGYIESAASLARRFGQGDERQGAGRSH